MNNFIVPGLTWSLFQIKKNQAGDILQVEILEKFQIFHINRKKNK